MTTRADRLRRVARKYNIARRTAILAQAQTEQHLLALQQTQSRLGDARAALAPIGAATFGAMLAAHSEWSSRFADAHASLAGPLHIAIASRNTAARAAERARGKAELIERSQNEAERSEARDREAQNMLRMPLRSKPPRLQH